MKRNSTIIICLIALLTNVLNLNLMSAQQKNTHQIKNISKVSKSNISSKLNVRSLNTIRKKFHRENLHTDSLINIKMKDIASITNYNNSDTLRNELRKRNIGDYNIKVLKIKQRKTNLKLGLDIQKDYPELYKVLKDSDYNKVGFYQTQNELTLLLVKSYMSIKSIKTTAQFTIGCDSTPQTTKILYYEILGKATKKIYYKFLKDGDRVATINKSIKKTDDLYQDANRFSLKVNLDVNYVEFVDENDNLIYIFDANYK